MSTITYLFAVADRHYILGDPSPNIYHTRHIIHSTKGAKLLYDLVKKAKNDHPVYHILSDLITSTDDTTVFVFKGVASREK